MCQVFTDAYNKDPLAENTIELGEDMTTTTGPVKRRGELFIAWICTALTCWRRCRVGKTPVMGSKSPYRPMAKLLWEIHLPHYPYRNPGAK